MSPDQYKSNPKVQRLLAASAQLALLCPNLYRVAIEQADDFAGLAVFLGDTQEFVVIVNRFGSDGAPERIFSGGSDLVDVFVNLNQALGNGDWKIDKRKTTVRKGETPSEKK